MIITESFKRLIVVLQYIDISRHGRSRNNRGGLYFGYKYIKIQQLKTIEGRSNKNHNANENQQLHGLGNCIIKFMIKSVK